MPTSASRSGFASSGPALPRRVELVYKRVSGEPKARIDFTRWDLAPQVADGTFTFQPRADSTKVAVEQFVATQLSEGRDAGPAALATPERWLRGTAVRVAHFRMRGAVVSMEEDR